MAKGRKRRIVVAIGFIVSVALVAILAKARLCEAWYLWRLQSEAHETAKEAAIALGRLQSKKAIPGLIAIMTREAKANHDNGELLGAAAAALFEIGMPAFLQLLDSLGRLPDGEFICFFVASTIEGTKISSRDVAYTGELSSFLRSTNVDVRLLAASSLGKIGAGAKDALPHLEQLLSDKNDVVRSTANDSIGRIRSATEGVSSK